MLQFEIKTYKELDFSHVIFLGKASTESVIDALKKYYASEVTLKVLWDFSKCDVSALFPDDINKIIETLKYYAPLRINGKSAILAPSDMSYGIGRMFSAMFDSNKLPIENEIFRTMDEALAWLKV